MWSNSKARLGWWLSFGLLIASGTPAWASVPAIPAVRPIPDDGNLPLNSAMYSGSMDFGDLGSHGYVEREFYISGKANVRDQETSAVLKADLPYTSRIVIRMPLNPKTFSGNVIIEPFHAVMEKTDMWMQTHPFITRHGDVWVGFTVKAHSLDMEPTSAYMIGGIPMLKAYDAERYGPLNLEPDNRPLVKAPPAPTPPQAIELMGQVAALFKTNDIASPLRGMRVQKVYAMGTGINGETIANYVRTKMDQVWRLPNDKPLIDGYFVGATNRFITEPPRGAAYIMFRSENEMDRAANFGFLGKDPDTAAFRIYNVPGISHLGTKNINGSTGSQMNGVLPKPEAGMPYAVDSSVCSNMNDEPVNLLLRALLSRLEAWGTNGTPLPSSPVPETTPGDAGAPMGDPTGAGEDDPSLKVMLIKRDALSGNVIGGVRMPWVEAPVAAYPVKRPQLAGGPSAGGPPGGMPPAASDPAIPLDIMHGDKPGAIRPREVSSGPVQPVDAWPRASKEKSKFVRGGPPFCFLFNPRLPLDRPTLRKLYSSYDDYLTKFERAKANAVKAGWLLAEDAATLRPRGAPEDF